MGKKALKLKGIQWSYVRLLDSTSAYTNLNYFLQLHDIENLTKIKCLWIQLHN